MKTTETKVVSIRPSATIGKFLVILKPNPFPLHPKFSHFQFNPDFEHITTEAQVDHLAVYTTKKPRLRVGQTITIQYELRLRPKEMRWLREDIRKSTAALRNEQKQS
jgi:hypothetical protein